MRAPFVRRSLLAAALAIAVAGCALNPPPTAEELRKDALPHTAVPPAWTAGGGVAAPVADRWLASFNDPALSALVEEALAYNADLQVAAARVEQAAGYVKVASASLLPSVGVAALGGGKSGGSGGIDGVWLNASLELDIWGRVRYGQAASEAQSEAFAADYAYARQSLAAMVVKSWFLATEAGLQRDIAMSVLQSAESLLRVAQERLRVGNGNEQAVAEARVNVGAYRDKLRQVELAREQALRALELLLGRYPAAEVKVAEYLSPMPPPVPVGMPSQLLERRPDVIAAERRVAAAFDRVGEAKAAQLPRISLTAGGSSVSSDLIVLKDVSNPIWSFGGNLIAPPVQGRRAARAGRDPLGRAETSSRRVRARRPARVRRGRKRARGRESAARPRRHPRGQHSRQRARAGTRADPVSRGFCRSAYGRAEPVGLVCRALLAPERAGRAAGAARQPLPRARRRFRRAGAGAGAGGGAMMQGRAVRSNQSMETKMAKKNAAAKDKPKGDAKKDKGAAAKAVAKKPGASASAKKFSGKDYAREMKKLHVELVKLQQWVQHKGLKVCIVFEGRDGAGKGGTIKAITERTSPRVFRVIALPAPTDREKTQMYAQRYLPHLPAAGEVVIFDRSWYNRAGVERVMGFCSKEEAQGFLQVVPLFEKLMIKSGIILLKYWLEVSPEEQERRLRGDRKSVV